MAERLKGKPPTVVFRLLRIDCQRCRMRQAEMSEALDENPHSEGFAGDENSQ